MKIMKRNKEICRKCANSEKEYIKDCVINMRCGLVLYEKISSRYLTDEEFLAKDTPDNCSCLFEYLILKPVK